jgi:hypothetical protein
MILLQATTTQDEVFHYTTLICSNYTDVITTVGVILNALYVFYTVRTFRQIKKQTDLQLNAHLSADVKLVKNITADAKYNFKNEYIDTTLSDSWKKSMQQSFPDLATDTQLFDGNYFSIKFHNYGNTEVKAIELVVDIEIKNSKSSIENKKLTPIENKKLTFKISEEIAKGEFITIPLFPTASFPIYSIKVTTKHTDVRGTTYPSTVIQYNNENVYIQ